MKQILIVGYGDIGRRVALLAGQAGFSIIAASRSVELKDEEESKFLQPVAANLDRLGTLPQLPTKEALVLYLAPPPSTGTTDPRVKNFCNSIYNDELPQKIVYISTSGVYGDCDGELVDETRPPNPQADRSRRRLDAEETFRSWGKKHRVPVVTLRVAGIYGPGRLPLQRIKKRVPLLRHEESPYSNRIHANDLARTCLAALQKGTDGAIYNVCDGDESSMTDYFLAIAEVFELPPPPMLSMDEARDRLSPEMLSYLRESRRLDNRRMLEKLGVELRYPDLRSGLRAIRKQGTPE